MKSFSAQLRLHQKMVFDNGNLWGPLLFWVVSLLFNYGAQPQDFVGSLALLLMVLFVLMTWLTYSYINQFPLPMEKLLILKLKQQRRFYLGLISYLSLLGLIFVLIGILSLAVTDWLNGRQAFGRGLNWWDWLGGTLMLTSVLPVSVMTGLFWQRRILANRRIAGLLTILMVVLGSFGEAIVKYWHPYLYILGILPPVSTMAQLFNTLGTISLVDILLAWAMSLGYSLVLLLIDQLILRKRKFLF
ncbi:hypothetical protein [Latilactobacillus graminis]|nr:hypothetical protein [Latilactobacillus graminis]QFP78768.1 hypothetical protein LG542_00225 [Latilactobacillus graminis]